METKRKIICMMVFPVTIYRCESWIVKEAYSGKNGLILTVVLKTTLWLSWPARKTNMWVPDQIKAELSLDAKLIKPNLWAHHEKTQLTGKGNHVGKG